MHEAYRTRIAPSPTGDMHLGTARTAYFNWLAARASGGTFLLRIDDTDTERNKAECVDVILKTMDYLGLNYDQRLTQSERSIHYKHWLDALKKRGLARTVDNGAVVLNLHDGMPKTWHDEIAGEMKITDMQIGCITGEHKNMEGKPSFLVLARADGSPTYQFASTVDDWEWRINYIIRGTDHISNTFKQLAIWSALDECVPTQKSGLPKFAHVGLIMKDKKKLSKRDGASSMLQYMADGIDPEAMLNFMLLLGWGLSTPRGQQPIHKGDIMSRAQALQYFLHQGTMKNVNASMDPQKLLFMDKTYKKAVPKAA